MVFRGLTLYIWTLLLFAKICRAQNADPIFKSLQLADGLSNNKVNCILQDQRGFLWFGTEDGLNRYDGKYFEVFKNEANDPTGISGKKITDLYEDKTGILWIGAADGGLTKYDFHLPASRQFRQFNHVANDPNSLPENGINKITEDRSGNLWMAVGNYVVRFNKASEKFDLPLKKMSQTISAFWMDDHDTLWIGRVEGGFLKVNTRTLQFVEEMDGRVWHCALKSIFRQTDVVPGIPSNEIVSCAVDHQMQVWMAGKNTGVMVYNRQTGKWSNYRNTLVKGSLASDHVNVVYVDRQGIVWIGTSNGLSILNPLFYPFVQHFLPKTGKDISVYDFYKDARRKLWIGTSDGIYTQSEESRGYEHRKIVYMGHELAVYKFFFDTDGTVYLGTDHSLFKYDANTNRVSSLPGVTAEKAMNSLIDSKIISIAKDTIGGHPVILVASSRHCFAYYDLVKKRCLPAMDRGNGEIRKLYKDRNGNLWLATSKQGLGRLSQQDTAQISYKRYDPGNCSSISSDDVYDIQENSKGDLWVSTYGGGLNYYDKASGTFSRIAESADLTEGLQSDLAGNVWMICNGHLHKYEPGSRIYSCYDLPDLRLSGGIRGYIYKDRQGIMYAGGENYYVTFDPWKTARIEGEPNVFLTDFRIFDSSHSELLEKRSIELDHSQNYFSFEYSAPDYSGDNIQYAYMLEGSDKDWVTAGKRNYVSYSNLPAGDYLFKVRASNWTGNNFTKFTSVAIHIRPPFWVRWWFYASVLAALISLCYLFYRLKINELLKRQAIRNGIAQDLHDQIGSTLGSISVYAGVARLYQQQEKNDKLKNVLHTIEETATETIGEMADLVWAVNPVNDNLGSIIQRIETFARPLCAAKGIALRINADPKLRTITPPMLIRKNLFMMMKELINNAIRHADCRNITLDVIMNRNMLELSISDDGIGFDAALVDAGRSASLSGNGLPNIRRRAKELNAEVEIQSERYNGASIKIKLLI